MTRQTLALWALVLCLFVAWDAEAKASKGYRGPELTFEPSPIPGAGSSASFSCEFYEKLETLPGIDATGKNAKGCGPQGYPIRYGRKFCGHFSNIFGASDLSQNPEKPTNKWIVYTMNCLQTAIKGEVNRRLKSGKSVTCDDLEELAFDTHPQCYAGQGRYSKLGAPSICSFEPLQFAKFSAALAGAEAIQDYASDALLSGPGLKQVCETAYRCSQLGTTWTDFFENAKKEAEAHFVYNVCNKQFGFQFGVGGVKRVPAARSGKSRSAQTGNEGNTGK